MADITNHLNTIINAVHGEDVRQAIHDGIEACYTDDRPGGADLKARQQINQILANIIGSNTYEESLYTGEIFIGGNDQNPVNITVTPHPGQYPYVLVYFKTIQSAVPEIRMFRGTDFETGPIVITSPFLESDGTRASIREFHIKRKSGGLNTEYQLYYTRSWILDGSSATDNSHDVGLSRTLTNADEDKALILCKITGFNPISDAAEQISEQLQLLMDFRDSVVTTETTTVATGTAASPAGSSSTYVDITLSATLPYNKDLKITVTSDIAQTGKSAVQVRSNVGAQAQIGELFSGETSGEFSYSPVGTEFTKIRILNPTVGATYSATVEQIEETYNSNIATQEYVDNKTRGVVPITNEQGQLLFEFTNEEVAVYDKDSVDADINDLHAQIGNLSNLSTANKSNVVSAINELVESQGESEDTGMSEDFKLALENLVKYLVFKGDDPNGQVYIDALHDALYPPIDLRRITASYTQSGTVYAGDALTSLQNDLTVIAYYTDGSTKRIDNYVLTGDLSERTSTITVNYYGMSTTFTVTVVPAVFDYNSKRDGLLTQKEGVRIDSSSTKYVETLSASNNLRLEGTSTGNTVSAGFFFGATPSEQSIWRLKIRAELYSLGETAGARCFRPQISNVTNPLRIGCHAYASAARFVALEGDSAVNIFSGVSTGDNWHEFELYGDPFTDVFTMSVDGIEQYRTTAANLANAQVMANGLYIIGKCVIYIRSIRLFNE